MGALTFLQAGFLAGLAALAIPIAIHLAHRRKARTLPFPSLRFLTAIDRRVARRYRLQEIIVLILRCLALALVALAFARPVLAPGIATWAGGGAAVRAIIIDNSLSMAAREQGVSLLERSVQAASTIIERMGPGDRAAVLPLVPAPGAPPPSLSSDRETLRAQLEAVRQTAASTDYAPALRAALALLAEEASPRREVLLLTDAQAAAVERAVAGAEGEPAEDETGPEEGPLGRPRIYVLIPRPPAAVNLTIEAVGAEAPAPGKAWVRATVRNFDGQAGRGRFALLADGEEIASKEVSVGAGGAVHVRLPLSTLAPGEHRIEARLSDDPIPLDNARRLVARGRQEIRALLVRDGAAPIPYQDEAFFLAHALAAGGKGGVRPKIAATVELASTDLSGYDVVFLLDPVEIPRDAAPALRSFVEAGGGLAWILGGRADADRYAALAAGGPSLVPAIPRAVAEAGVEPFGIARIREDHPLFAPLRRATPPVGFARVRVLRYRKLQILEPSAEVVAWVGEGDPLALVSRCGRGTVAVVGTSLRPAWTDLPLHVGFVPLVHVLARRLAGGGIAAPGFRVGESLVVR